MCCYRISMRVSAAAVRGPAGRRAAFRGALRSSTDRPPLKAVKRYGHSVDDAIHCLNMVNRTRDRFRGESPRCRVLEDKQKARMVIAVRVQSRKISRILCEKNSPFRASISC